MLMFFTTFTQVKGLIISSSSEIEVLVFNYQLAISDERRLTPNFPPSRSSYLTACSGPPRAEEGVHV